MAVYMYRTCTQLDKWRPPFIKYGERRTLFAKWILDKQRATRYRDRIQEDINPTVLSYQSLEGQLVTPRPMSQALFRTHPAR